MFYHFTVSLVFRMSAIVKEENSKLSVCVCPFCSGATRQYARLNVTPAALSAHSVLQSLYPVSSREPTLKRLRKQDAHCVTEQAHRRKLAIFREA